MNIGKNDSSESSFSLTRWRENLIVNILRGACILSLPTVIIGSFPMIQNGLWFQLILNIIAVLVLFIVTFVRISYEIRCVVSLLLLYGLGMNILLEVGLHGDARLFFFSFILLSLMLLGIRAALVSCALTLLSAGLTGWMLFAGHIALTNSEAVRYPPITWITDIIVLSALTGISLLGISTLMHQFTLARNKVKASLDELQREHERLELRVEERTHELEVLRQTSLEINAQLKLESLLFNIVDRGCKLLGVSGGGIYLVNRKTGGLELSFTRGLEKNYPGRRLAPDEGLAGKVFSTGESIAIENFSLWDGRSPSWEEESFSSALGVPLKYGSHVIGVLNFAEVKDRRCFDDHDIRLATLFANQASIAINNAFHYTEAQKEIAERIKIEAALRESQKQLLHDAFHDALTGLPNRVMLINRLDQAIKRTRRHPGYLFAIIFLDIDRFKVINDSLGHLIGDKLLIAIARRLEIDLRAIDAVVRLGGDEFVVFLEEIKETNDATRVASRILDELNSPFSILGHRIYITASMGIVINTNGYGLPEDILRDADIALYRAKNLGKARYELFDTKLRTQVIARLELENDLHQAFENQEFCLYYQPILNLKTNKIAGIEALVRWKHPKRGIVSPGEFIPAAEETGLIIPLGHWVLHEACCQMRSWQLKFPQNQSLAINVNLSPKQFLHHDLAGQITAIIKETGLDPHNLNLEITESIFIDERALDVLKQLNSLGIQIQIDDFGADYPSLHYLQHMPISTIKIDRSFVSTIKMGNKKAGIVRAIVSLAHELGITATAEGVETIEQLDFLKTLQCQYGQGFYLSRPLDSEKMTTFLSDSGMQ